MASGSTLTVSGGTNMVQVVGSSDSVANADYDNMVANVYRQLGTPADVTLGTYTASSTYGYNQSTGSLDSSGTYVFSPNSINN